MYKLTDYGVVKDENTFIVENGAGWPEYQQWLAEGNTPEPQYNQNEAMNKVVADIGVYSDGVKAQPFYYAPMLANFYLDTVSTTKITGNSSTKDYDWKTADKSVDGVKTKKVKFKKNELSDFNDYCTNREYDIGVTKETHVEAVQDMFLTGATAEEILDYDYTTEWPEG